MTDSTVVYDAPEEPHLGQRRATATKPERSRARTRTKAGKKPKPIKDDKPRRVRHCMHLMATGQWIPAITVVELAKLWKISERSVEGDAGEASRRIREGVMLDDDLRASVVATLQDIAKSAGEIVRLSNRTKQPRTAVEALRTKIDAVKAMAAIAGVEKAHKVELTGNTLDDLFALAHSETKNGEASGKAEESE